MINQQDTSVSVGRPQSSFPWVNRLRVTLHTPSGRWLAVLVSILLLLLLGLYNQPYYPATWLDEGFALQGAMNLVRFGRYAMLSSEGLRVLDQPLIANGPGVVLPIAAVFAVLGIGLLQARVLMAVYLALTALLFFCTARRLYGFSAALISMVLLLALPREGFLLFGRHALGNVPALGYFLAGFLLWLLATERGTWRPALGAGVLFGLAIATKGQYALLVPILLVITLLDHFYYRMFGWKRMALVILAVVLCQVIWYGAQLTLLGPDAFARHLDAIRSSSAVSVLAFRPARIPGSLTYLVRSGTLLVVAPALLYAAWQCRKRTLASLQQSFLVAFAIIWFAWYAFVSVGWPRYAFDGYAVSTILAGKAVFDAARFVQRNQPSESTGRRWPAARIAVGVFVMILLVVGVVGFAQQATDILSKKDRSATVFAEYLTHNLDASDVVESWEWELDPLTEVKFHHPTNDWVDRYTALLQFGEPLTQHYRPGDFEPTYLIRGPFSKWTGIYDDFLNAGCCKLVFTSGPYELYSATDPLGLE